MQKRLISMVLALSMALSAMPLPALAQSAPPDTVSAAALAEENGEITNLYTDSWSGEPVGDYSSVGNGVWDYDKDTNTLTLQDGTFRLYNYSYSSYNNYIKWNIKIEAGATLKEARIGSNYDDKYTVTNAGTISDGTFYGKVTCEAGAISGGTFKNAVTVDTEDGKVTINGGTFENGVTVDAVDTLTINGGTFKGGTSRSVEINGVGANVVINGGSFENVIRDAHSMAPITINSGLFQSKVIAEICEVNGGLFTAASDPLSVSALVKGGYFVADHAGDAGNLVAINAQYSPVYAPVAVAENGTVNEWSADAYDTLYVVSGKKVTLRPTYKLKSVVSGGAELNYDALKDAVRFTVGTEAVQLNSVTVGELVIEESGFPEGTDGGVYGAKGNGWSFDPNHQHAELFSQTVPTLIIEKDAALNFDKVKNDASTVKFAVENYGTFSGKLDTDRYVYNREGGVITGATLNSAQSLYNDGLVKDSVLRFDYIGNGWRDPAQPATIRNSALDITGWLLANMASNNAVLDGCYNSADYTGTAVIGNGGTVKNGKSTLKLPVENTAGASYQPTIDGGEYTTVYNEGGIIQNNPIIHALVAKDTKDLNGAADYYTLNYTAPVDAEYAKKYINGINGMMEGVWDAESSTLYVDTDLNTISVITHAPIKSVNGVAYNGSVRYDTERYSSTIDLSKYNIPQTHILNLSATGEGAAELPSADPADFAFVLPNNLTYDGSPKEVTVKNTSNKDYGAITVTYMQNGKVLDGAPIEPGDYSYTVTVAGSAQYAGGTVKTGSFRIIAETTPEEPPEQPPQEDSTEFSPLQTVAIVAGTTAWFAGSAVMGYEAVTYSILADLLPKGTAIPRTREQLAVLLWSTAGKPEPAAPAVYSDVAEPDTAKAARWAVEAGLLPDMGEGAFTPRKRVTKVQVIRAWNQLKKLGLAK